MSSAKYSSQWRHLGCETEDGQACGSCKVIFDAPVILTNSAVLHICYQWVEITCLWLVSRLAIQVRKGSFCFICWQYFNEVMRSVTSLESTLTWNKSVSRWSITCWTGLNQAVIPKLRLPVSDIYGMMVCLCPWVGYMWLNHIPSFRKSRKRYLSLSRLYIACDTGVPWLRCLLKSMANL